MAKLKLPFDQGEIDLQLPYFFKIEDNDILPYVYSDTYVAITGHIVESIEGDASTVLIKNVPYLAPCLPILYCFQDFEEKNIPITKEQYLKQQESAKKKCSTMF